MKLIEHIKQNSLAYNKVYTHLQNQEPRNPSELLFISIACM